MLKPIAAYARKHHLALLALFFALGGTSFAAANVLLPRNSVGTKQLRKNAVISSKIRNNSVRGADVFESSLAEVPSAANAVELGGIPASGFYTKPEVDAKTGEAFANLSVPTTGTTRAVATVPGLGELDLACPASGGIHVYYSNTTSSGHRIWVVDDGSHGSTAANGDSAFVSSGARWDAQGPDPVEHSPVNGVPNSSAQVTTWLISAGNSATAGAVVHVGITRVGNGCPAFVWGHALG
jgi:hypothetical protein